MRRKIRCLDTYTPLATAATTTTAWAVVSGDLAGVLARIIATTSIAITITITSIVVVRTAWIAFGRAARARWRAHRVEGGESHTNGVTSCGVKHSRYGGLIGVVEVERGYIDGRGNDVGAGEKISSDGVLRDEKIVGCRRGIEIKSVQRGDDRAATRSDRWRNGAGAGGHNQHAHAAGAAAVGRTLAILAIGGGTALAALLLLLLAASAAALLLAFVRASLFLLALLLVGLYDVAFSPARLGVAAVVAALSALAAVLSPARIATPTTGADDVLIAVRRSAHVVLFFFFTRERFVFFFCFLLVLFFFSM